MKLLQAILMLSGMIIGVGMFGIPFSFAQSGFWLGAGELIILAGVVTLLHFLYGEIVLRTSVYHRLPGYVALHLGKRALPIAWFSSIFGIVGSLLVYLLVGSIFLNTIASRFWPNSTEFIWVLVLVIVGGIITAFPLKREALINGILTAISIIFIVFLTIWLLPHVSLRNLSGIHFKNIFAPYGVLLFALSGGVVIPDLITLLKRNRAHSRIAIIIGTLIPALLYVCFAFTVAGVAGIGVSTEAIKGLTPFVGQEMVFFGSIIGFLAIFTSLVALSSSFQSLLVLDVGFSRIGAGVVGTGLPFFFYLLGFQDFITIIGVIGTIAVGIDVAFILALFNTVRRKEGKVLSHSIYIGEALLYGMILTGVVYELFHIFY